MPLEVVVIPCLSDNFSFLLHETASGATAAIDVPEAAPVIAALAARGWALSDVLLTHHHADHVGGLAELKAATNPAARVVGARADANRLPPLDLAVAGSERFVIGGADVHVLDVPGHTLGHVAYHVPEARAAFTGDSLMAMGCGRLFEGSAAQMWASLQALAALPDDTRIFSGHDYIAGNAAFALSIEPANPDIAARARAHATDPAPEAVHVPLATERATNPFLRAAHPDVKAALGMADAPDQAVFAALRSRKDVFAAP